MADKFEHQTPGLTSPGIDAFPVAPRDGTSAQGLVGIY